MDLVDRVDLMDLMDRVDNKKKGFFTPQGTDFQSVTRVDVSAPQGTDFQSVSRVKVSTPRNPTPPLPHGSPPVLLLLPYEQLFNPITP